VSSTAFAALLAFTAGLGGAVQIAVQGRLGERVGAIEALATASLIGALLALIVLLFLAALPFMGLKPLWATGKATALMLWLQILLMIFLNAVYQNGRGDAPYTSWVRTLVRAAVVLLPIYTALCVYALYLRIDQHGWSTDRFWAVLLTFIVGLHVVGYAVAAVRQRNVWMAGMATVNIAIAAVTVALAVMVNSPILDAQRISAASQVARLLDGRTAAAEFDYKYLRFDLGRPGNAALARLKEITDHPQSAAIQRGAELALNRTTRAGPERDIVRTAEQTAKHFSVYPAGEHLDDAFLEYAMSRGAAWQLQYCLAPNQRCAVLVIDLNQDRRKDYVLFRIAQRWERFAAVFIREDRAWRLAGHLDVGNSNEAPSSLELLEAQLAKGDYAVMENPWHNLRIGKHTQRFRPE